MMKRPCLLRKRIPAADEKQLSAPIILDEVQKVPQILDEVHALIEDRGLGFILCGSSARKLKASGRNPDLLSILNRGLIPPHFLEPEYRRSLQAYVYDYLKEEVMAEGLARNVPAFSRFLDAVAFSHGEIINLSNIARDCGVDSKTVREYFQILVDTLLGEGEVAIEANSASRIDKVDLRGLTAFLEELSPAKSILVCNEAAPRKVGGIDILPWRVFLERLWAGKIIQA
jgi:predicted AAA+ superfamily ATPase